MKSVFERVNEGVAGGKYPNVTQAIKALKVSTGAYYNSKEFKAARPGRAKAKERKPKMIEIEVPSGHGKVAMFYGTPDAIAAVLGRLQ